MSSENIDLIIKTIEQKLKSFSISEEDLILGSKKDSLILITTEKKGMMLLSKKLSSESFKKSIEDLRVLLCLSYNKRKGKFRLIKIITRDRTTNAINLKEENEEFESFLGIMGKFNLRNSPIIIILDTIHTGSEIKMLLNALKDFAKNITKVYVLFGNSNTKNAWNELIRRYGIRKNVLHILYENKDLTNVMMDYLLKKILSPYPPFWLDRKPRNILVLNSKIQLESFECILDEKNFVNVLRDILNRYTFFTKKKIFINKREKTNPIPSIVNSLKSNNDVLSGIALHYDTLQEGEKLIREINGTQIAYQILCKDNYGEQPRTMLMSLVIVLEEYNQKSHIVLDYDVINPEAVDPDEVKTLLTIMPNIMDELCNEIKSFLEDVGIKCVFKIISPTIFP